jgi:hypothetical protein
MDHEARRDCPFLGRCDTFRDRLIREDRKGPKGFGCRKQTDVFRSRHCHSFRCMYLTMVITDALGEGRPKPALEGD